MFPMETSRMNACLAREESYRFTRRGVHKEEDIAVPNVLEEYQDFQDKSIGQSQDVLPSSIVSNRNILYISSCGFRRNCNEIYRSIVRWYWRSMFLL
jgi:hypothetical protein